MQKSTATSMQPAANMQPTVSLAVQQSSFTDEEPLFLSANNSSSECDTESVESESDNVVI